MRFRQYFSEYVIPALFALMAPVLLALVMSLTETGFR